MREWLFFFVGVALALMGMWLTIYLRPGRRLNIHIATIHLTDKTISPDPEIALRFQNSQVSGIARHVIYVWNSGNVSIRSSDLASDTPLRVRFGENSMLSLRGLQRVGQTFHLEPAIKEHFIYLPFDHLDTGQGFVFWAYEGIVSYEGHSEPSFEGHILDSKGIISGIMPFSASKVLKQQPSAGIGVIALLTIVLALPFAIMNVVGIVGPFGFGFIAKYSATIFAMLFIFMMGQWTSLWNLAVSLRYRVPKFPNLERK